MNINNYNTEVLGIFDNYENCKTPEDFFNYWELRQRINLLMEKLFPFKELVEVKPMKQPTSSLFYLDFKYKQTTTLENIIFNAPVV